MEKRIDIHHPVTVCKASAGTGKTFTLAAYYIGLLMSGEDYRSILAITFTNKATAEMSERILSYLHAIGQGTVDANFMDSVRSFMFRNTDKDTEWLQARAKECFKHMLEDFDNVKIQTIDSFLQTLLNGLAGMLHQSAGMSTELDVDHVINEAVDQLLTTEMTEQDLTIMRDFLYMRLDQEGTVYIQKSLVGLAKELYNEAVQMLDSRGEIVFDAQQITARRERLAQQRETSPEIIRLRGELETCWKTLSAEPLDKSYGGHAVNAINDALTNIRMSLDKPDELKKDLLFRGLSEGYYKNAVNRDGRWVKVPPYLADMAIAMSDAAHRCKAFYDTIDLTVALSYEMQLMTSLQRLIQRNLTEANCALLSKTASVLDNALRGGDADFILEKAGIRYHHVLMDEFQDTSKLQWSVIEKLLQELVAGEGNTVLIVGDIKQSIYRWRNGDWHIMDGLTSEGTNELTNERINGRFTSLKRNFRSSEEVVRFNLSFFRFMMDHYPDFHERLREDEAALIRRIYDEQFEEDKLDAFYQSKKKKGGYVCFRALESKDECLTQLFDTMEQLLPDIAPEDMMVLVRGGADAQYITDAHAYLDAEQYPNLSKASFVSASSFQLDASEAVNTLIAALRWIVNKDDQVAAHQVALMRGTDILDTIRAQVSVRTPLYEAVSELVRLLLTNEEGQYCGTETAYINNLLDRTRDYVRAYGSDIAQFLQYWDETLHEKPIPTSAAGAIRILTIHKSKGLQAQTLFIPFCNWAMDEGKASSKIWCPIAPVLEEGSDFIPVPNRSEMADSAYSEAYSEEHMNLRVDSLNMLYVALTRAEDNLFVFSEYKPTKDGKAPKHVGSYLVAMCGTEYVKGERLKVKGERLELTSEGVKGELWANSDRVRFVQSQEGALYTENGDEAYRRVARMEEGTLCHEIFANIHKADEQDAVLDDFETRGEIRDKAQREELRRLISSAWTGNAEMRSWFVDPWELKLEQGIMGDNKEIRPDRVMIDKNTNDAIVLDYKFGKWNDHYFTQVRQYMEALEHLGHPHVRGYLWYARENRLVEVKG